MILRNADRAGILIADPCLSRGRVNTGTWTRIRGCSHAPCYQDCPRRATGGAEGPRLDRVTRLHSWPVCQRRFPPPLPGFRSLLQNRDTVPSPAVLQSGVCVWWGVSGRGSVRLARDLQTVPPRAWAKDSGAQTLRAPRLQFPREPKGEARVVRRACCWGL